ncbi:MAG TPA: hypothetical protein DHU96_30175 [Actinobacteria bacterium]|nr:hypothetical protein [Actinomycetota bacterium]
MAAVPPFASHRRRVRRVRSYAPAPARAGSGQPRAADRPRRADPGRQTPRGAPMAQYGIDLHNREKRIIRSRSGRDRDHSIAVRPCPSGRGGCGPAGMAAARPAGAVSAGPASTARAGLRARRAGLSAASPVA